MLCSWTFHEIIKCFLRLLVQLTSFYVKKLNSRIYRNYLITYHFVRNTVNYDGLVLRLPQLLLLIDNGQERIIHPSRKVTRNQT